MKFSIITPTYNRADLIERAIKSILNQSYQNFEMIIVDDGSIDNTDEIVSKYLIDNRIRYIKAKTNGGVSKARNIGMKNISKDTDWITFLDSDDEFLDDALANMIRTIGEKSTINYFRFGTKTSKNDIVSNDKLIESESDYIKYIKDITICGEWVITLKRNVIENGFLYDERFFANESFSYLNLSKLEKLFYSKYIVRIYHLESEGMTRQSKISNKSLDNSILAMNITIEEFSDDLKLFNRNYFALILYSLSYYYIKRKFIIKGLIYNFKAFRYQMSLRFVRNLLVFIKVMIFK